MIFNKGDEKEAIKVLFSMLSELTDQLEYNAVCFAIENLRQAGQENVRIEEERNC